MPIHTQKILMCAPDYFGVDYVINPWMEGQKGSANVRRAEQQWRYLLDRLSDHVELVFVPPQPGLPDLVFTANAGLVIGNRVVVSQFRAVERQGEEPHFHQWFRDQGFDCADWPREVSFEGAGDALMQRGEPILWVGYGFRSDVQSPTLLAKLYDRRVIGLRLVDPRFYHLDTCFCPLEDGFVMYFPPAFDEESQKLIVDNVPENRRLIVAEADALQFACNAVDVNRHVFMNGASTTLQDNLRSLGLTPVITPLSEFMKAGGAAKCLTLKLVEP